MTTAVQDLLTPEKRAELQRLARGERDTTPVPMGIRATTGRTDRPAPPAATTPDLVGHVDHLLSFAMRSENGRTRAAAEKIYTLAADLAQRCHTEYTTRRQKLDAEITALEEKLADARARLNALDHDITAAATPSPPITEPARPAGTKSAVDAAAVRAWAADNGYDLNPIGRIPKDVTNAWREAREAAT